MFDPADTTPRASDMLTGLFTREGSYRRGRYGWLIGYFWSSVWLLFLLEPLRAAWHRGSWLGIAGVFGFAVVYIAHFHRRGWMFSDSPGAAKRVVQDRPLVAGTRWLLLVVLGAFVIVMVGQTGTSCLIFIGISAMWTFNIRRALVLAFLTGWITWGLWHVVPGWQSDYGSLTGLSFGTLACAVGRVSAERKWALDASREDAAILRIQEERNRMARDLHDILGHSLTVITMKAELAGRLVDLDADRAKQQIAEVEQLARGALADVRTTVSGYREMSLAGELARARRALTDAGLHVEAPGSVDEVEPDLRELFAWAVREGTTNVIRHSEARNCTITLAPTRLSIHDDGHDLVPGPGVSAGGTGLSGLRERAIAVGADVYTSSVDGFTLVVEAAVVVDEKEG